jgi:hypothetical protein
MILVDDLSCRMVALIEVQCVGSCSDDDHEDRKEDLSLLRLVCAGDIHDLSTTKIVRLTLPKPGGIPYVLAKKALDMSWDVQCRQQLRTSCLLGCTCPRLTLLMFVCYACVPRCLVRLVDGARVWFAAEADNHTWQLMRADHSYQLQRVLSVGSHPDVRTMKPMEEGASLRLPT